MSLGKHLREVTPSIPRREQRHVLRNTRRLPQGVLAKNKDLKKAFGTDNQVEACKIILDKGEMQVRWRHYQQQYQHAASAESSANGNAMHPVVRGSDADVS